MAEMSSTMEYLLKQEVAYKTMHSEHFTNGYLIDINAYGMSFRVNGLIRFAAYSSGLVVHELEKTEKSNYE